MSGEEKPVSTQAIRSWNKNWKMKKKKGIKHIENECQNVDLILRLNTFALVTSDNSCLRVNSCIDWFRFILKTFLNFEYLFLWGGLWCIADSGVLFQGNIVEQIISYRVLVEFCVSVPFIASVNIP